MDKPTSADTTPATSTADSDAEAATDTEPATTDAAATARPSAADVTLLQELQQFELAARELFRAWSGELGAPATPAAGEDYDGLPGLVAQIAANHDQWSATVGGLLGVQARHTVDQDVFDEWESQLTGPDAAAAALAFESAALDKLFELIGELQSTAAINVLVSMARVAGEHCVALAAASGDTADLDLLLGTTGASA